MGLIVNEVNPWGGEAKRLWITNKVVSHCTKEVAGDEFYIFSTPEYEESRTLSFIAKDRHGAGILIATLEGAIHQIKKVLAEGE